MEIFFEWVVVLIVATSPVWIPVAFLCYVILSKRKRNRDLLLVCFLLAEGAAILARAALLGVIGH
jgi:hypothetical protein